MNALLKKRKWNDRIIWAMLEMIAMDYTDTERTQVFKEIYKWAIKCKTYTEFEDYLDKFTY